MHLAFTVQKWSLSTSSLGALVELGFLALWASGHPTPSLGDLPSWFQRLLLTGCWVKGISTLHFTHTWPRPKTAAREEDCNWLANLLASSMLLDAWSIRLSSNTWGSSLFFTKPLSQLCATSKIWYIPWILMGFLLSSSPDRFVVLMNGVPMSPASDLQCFVCKHCKWDNSLLGV